MKYAVNVKKLENWMKQNEPMAIEKLAAASRISTKTLERVLKGNAPGHSGTRYLVSQAIGVDESTLFPAKEMKSA